MGGQGEVGKEGCIGKERDGKKEEERIELTEYRRKPRRSEIERRKGVECRRVRKRERQIGGQKEKGKIKDEITGRVESGKMMERGGRGANREG